MKLRIFIFLLFLSAGLRAQVIVNDTLPEPKVDSTFEFGGIEADTIPVDELPDYAESYRDDVFRITWGLRAVGALSKMNTSEGDIVRITANGTPQTDANGVLRDQLIPNGDFVTMYQGSIFMRMIKGSFYFQPELVYARKGGKFDILDKNGVLQNRVEAKFNTIDIPLLAGLRFRDARIFAGPLFSMALPANDSFNNVFRNYTNKDVKKDFFTNPTINSIIGLGFEFQNIFFELRYEAGVTNYVKTDLGPVNNPSNFYFRNNQILLSLGFIL